MSLQHCKYCDRTADFKRKIGFGTIVLLCLTSLCWLIVIPFYRKRCKICGSTEYTQVKKQLSTYKILKYKNK